MGYKKIFLLFIFLSCHLTTNPGRRLFRSAQDNFHEVEKNAFFRSRQLSPKRLKKFVKLFNIKTIINLRGENKDQKWWREEEKMAKQLEVEFYNIPMSAQRLPHKKDLLKLLDLYQNAPRPILVHCKGGADRTGEAAAIWMLTQQKKQKKDALKQLSFIHGHFSFLRPAKRFFIKLWQGEKWAKISYNPHQHPKYYKTK